MMSRLAGGRLGRAPKGLLVRLSPFIAVVWRERDINSPRVRFFFEYGSTVSDFHRFPPSKPWWWLIWLIWSLWGLGTNFIRSEVRTSWYKNWRMYVRLRLYNQQLGWFRCNIYLVYIIAIHLEVMVQDIPPQKCASWVGESEIGSNFRLNLADT